jgi:phosphatidylserine/phosphatidylglycerophosphate/cardiolipin synthase-like enzyme
MKRIGLRKMKKMKKSLLFFAGILISMVGRSQSIDIAAARAQGAGSTVTITGVVTNGSELGNVRYVQDVTGGLVAFGSSLSALIPGDNVTISGTLVDYNGLLEFNPVTSVVVNSQGNALPTPLVVTPGQIAEATEALLVRSSNVQFVNPTGTFAGNTSYQFTNGVDTGVIYVRNNHPMIGAAIPSGNLQITGLSSQFGTQYQLLVRGISDITNMSSIYLVTEPVQSAISTTGFTVAWNTNISGSTFMKYGLTPALELGYANNAVTGISHNYTFTNLQPGTIYYVKAYSTAGTDTGFSALKVMATQSLSSGDMRVFFNTPVISQYSTGTVAQYLPGTIEDTLISYLDSAKQSIDFTIYDFDNTNMSNVSAALNAAYARGVKVRFISDGSLTATNLGVTQLNPAIPKVLSPTGGVYSIMHNKFVIIDADAPNPNDAFVWTGSTNLTRRQVYQDPNSVILIQDQTLARAYTLEFEEMWGDTGMTPNSLNQKFGPNKTDNTPHLFNINGVRVESYFSPSDNTNSRIVEKVNAATHDIFFASMIITRSDIANAIATQIGNGMITNGIMNQKGATGSQWPMLSANMGNDLVVNNDTTLTTNPVTDTTTTIMHHKYMFTDAQQTNSNTMAWIGSHNWTTSANTKNDENSLAVYSPIIVNQYYQEFAWLFGQYGGIVTSNKAIEHAASAFRIYPNPSTEDAFVEFLADEALTAQVSITDITGKLVRSEQWNLTQGVSKHAINTSTLAQGTYFVQVKAGANSYQSKFMKQSCN